MTEGRRHQVGPVLAAGPLADAVIAAIRDENPLVSVVDRGAYLRVLVPLRCRVTRSAIEQRAARPFSLPSDLERIMPSFKGRLRLSDDEVSWELTGPDGEG